MLIPDVEDMFDCSVGDDEPIPSIERLTTHPNLCWFIGASAIQWWFDYKRCLWLLSVTQGRDENHHPK